MTGRRCSSSRLQHNACAGQFLLIVETSRGMRCAQTGALTIDRLDALLAAGDRDAVVTTTMREVAGLPPQVVEQLRAQPSWQARVAAAHTIPRELRAVKAYRFDPARFRDLRVPTLLLVGGASAAVFRTTARAVDEALSDSRVVVLPGQGHAAMDTATDLFTTECTAS